MPLNKKSKPNLKIKFYKYKYKGQIYFWTPAYQYSNSKNFSAEEFSNK